MRTVRPFVSRRRVAPMVIALALVGVACPKDPPPEASKTDDEAPDDAVPAAKAGPGKITEAADPFAKTPDPGETAGPAEAEVETSAADAKGDPAAVGGEPEGADGEAAPDPAALLKQAKSKRTKDDQALELLGQAEAAGAEPRDLAKAANTRGLTLYSSPDRARKFFDWAAEKDPKYPDPMFNIAKQFAMTGDIPMIKEFLTKTRERGGKKLLKQIEFDPTWEIVKDDPEVRKLLR